MILYSKLYLTSFPSRTHAQLEIILSYELEPHAQSSRAGSSRPAFERF